MKLTLGFSPCPNDTFIFDALIHGKIDTEGIEFDVTLGDVEALNQKAFKAELDITKLSYHTYAYLLKEYVLLNAGSALGNNCGPLLISKSEIRESEINEKTVAIPGKFTTANFLLGYAYPNISRKEEMIFSEIETAVLDETTDAGLIIHENRFTYQEKGLKKVIDLGEYWENQTGLPIPLGGIVIKRNLPEGLKKKVDRVLRRSVEYALNYPEQTMDYVKPHAQEMDPKVMLQHIGLYVNDYTVDLGQKGRKAVEHLIETAQSKGLVPASKESLFLD
ncbi:MAG: 1,4-dihydroxy-6-naphthoate synthase [Bacteroidota bacterium]